MKITEFRDIATQTFSHALAKRENLPEKQNNFLPVPAPIAPLLQRQKGEKWKQQRGPSEGKKGFGDGKNPRRPAPDCTPQGRCRRHDLRCNETTQQTPSAPSQPAWETPNTASVPSGFFSGVCCSRERQGGVGGGAKISPGGQDDKKQGRGAEKATSVMPPSPAPPMVLTRGATAPLFRFPSSHEKGR